ncbi:serine/threonine-protein kinase [Nonomuraea sp. NPDC050556]|uniref:serine/threonine-protein kinase n=1 Tax=Nonomuraea sp. NPDC050556 TaxID=3364369 RepID=UPI0037B83012
MQPVEDAPGYRVLDQAGQGGFAIVYRAFQERLDRVVALKVLSVDRVDQRTLRRFQRELQLTGRLTAHPNVVTVFDTGTTRSGKPYIAMEFFENGSLRDRVRNEGPLPLADVLRAGVKLAGALAAVHEAGVLHGDIKPQNILISRYGEPAIADFGVARVVDSSEVSAAAAAFTPLHAAPEVLSGQPHSVSTDIYSLGSTLYHLLAGQPAFHSPTDPSIAPLMFRVLSNSPPPIGRSDVPASAEAVIMRAMSKQAHERYGTARSFARALQEVQREHGLPVTDLIGADPLPGSATVPRSDVPPPAAPPTPTTPPPSVTTTGQHAAAASPYAPPTSPGVASSGPLSGGPPSAGPPGGGPLGGGPLGGGPLGVGPPQGFGMSPPAAAPPPRVEPPRVAPPHVEARRVEPPRVDPRVEPLAVQRSEAEARPTYPVPPAVPRATGLGRAAAGSAKRGNSRVKLVVGLAVGLLVVLGTGTAVYLSRTQDPAVVVSQKSGEPAVKEHQTAQPIDPAAVKALTPRKVRVVADNGATVTLKWSLPPAATRYPVVLQREPFEENAQRITALKAGTTGTRVLALNPDLGYCFVIGVALQISEASTVAWSEPACIRGAVPTN